MTKSKTNEEEKERFDKYVKNTKHRGEEKYRILKIMCQIPYHSLLGRNEVHYDTSN